MRWPKAAPCGSRGAPVPAPVPVVAAPPVHPAIDDRARWSSRCWNARLRPGEVSLDDLERAFRETETEARRAPKPAPPIRLARREAKEAAKETAQGS